MKIYPERERKSIRLPGYDYALPGAYFVTIVARLRAYLFGTILDGEMCLSAAGHVAEDSWRAIPLHFPHAELGAFVVMPNHIHGIIILHERGAAMSSPPVGAQHAAPLPQAPGRSVAPGSLGAIVRSYKAAVTRQIVQRLGGGPTIWQRNFYEHIIRDERDRQNIHDYILSNPSNWASDEENPA